MSNNVRKSQEKVKDLDREFERLTKDRQGIIKEKEATEKLRKEAIKRRTQLELDSIKLSHDKKLEEVENLSTGIMEHEKQLISLNEKEDRAKESKAVRDERLSKDIDDLVHVLSNVSHQEKELQDEINDLKAQLREQDEHIERCQASEAQINDNVKKTSDSFIERTAERDKLQDRHKSLLAEVVQLELEKVKAQKNLDDATPDDVRRGLVSVRGICNEMGPHRMFGSIINLFNCDEEFFTAVEVTAGNSLFHVVVDSDETATRIIDYLNAQKGGRLTFIPLNTVKPPHAS